jgi:replicative DNA helicase
MADLDSEQKLLGLMLLDNRNASVALTLGLKASHLSACGHKTLYDAIIDSIIESHGCTDVLTICQYLTHHNQLEEIGGVKALLTIVESVTPDDRIDQVVEAILNL